MVNVLPANELQVGFEVFCQLRCENKLCHLCRLRDFMKKTAFDGGIFSAETSPGLNDRLITAIRSTRTGDRLIGVGSQGRYARIDYAPSGEFKTVPTMISTVLRLLILFPVLSIVEVRVAKERLLTERERAEQLISGEVIDAVKEDPKTFWDYFRPLLTDDAFADKLYRYLSGENNDAPLAAKKERMRDA